MKVCVLSLICTILTGCFLFASEREELEKVAVNGDAESQLALGEFYARQSSGQNWRSAVEWFRKAAEQGNARAQRQLGFAYHYGSGVQKNAEIAAEWNRKAAEQGDASAQVSLGVQYRAGDGVPRDFTKAVEWFRKAAEQGDAEGQMAIGAMYADGKGVPKDAAKGVEWVIKAAEQGNAGAQTSLGFTYTRGVGVPKDEIEGLAWYNIAAASGDDYSKQRIVDRDEAEARVGRLGTLAAQQRSREILETIKAAKVTRTEGKAEDAARPKNVKTHESNGHIELPPK